MVSVGMHYSVTKRDYILGLQLGWVREPELFAAQATTKLVRKGRKFPILGMSV